MENIIMIVSDQYRSDSIGINGCKAAHTPNLDNLAKEGVNFTNTFCQNPVCVPSRCSFLSGLYPHTTGHRTMHFLMKEHEQNLLRTMKENNYDVLWCGRNDFLNNDIDQSQYCTTRIDPTLGFMQDIKQNKNIDSSENMRERKHYYYSHFKGVLNESRLEFLDQAIFDNAIDYLDKYDKTKPFFLYLAGILPHPPYEVKDKFLQLINQVEITDPIRLTPEQLENKASILKGIRNNQEIYNLTNEQLKEIKAVYYAMGSALDEMVGKLVTSLKERDLYDSTTIIFTSDHGDFTGDYEIVEKNQNTFEDFLTNVPLIIKPSKTINCKPRTTNAITELVDIQATILEIANINPGYTHFGNSLINVLSGKDLNREFAHAEGGRLESEGEYAMDAGHSIDNEYWPRTIEQTKIPQHTKAVMVRSSKFKYVYRLYEDDEFYNLECDPYETTNLIGDNSNQILAELNRHKEECLRFMVATADVVPQKREHR